MSDFELLFFAGIAVFIGYKLWSVLGQHNGNEAAKASELTAMLEKELAKKVAAGKPKSPALEIEEVEEELIPPHLAKDISALRKVDAEFSLAGFTKGAAGAFEMVIESFAKGKKDALAFLLSKDLYKNFEKQIKSREKDSLEASSSVISVEEPEILDIELNGSVCQVMVRFVSEQINFIKDKAGEIIEGSKTQIESVTDIWTFERDLRSGKPNWVVVGTQSV